MWIRAWVVVLLMGCRDRPPPPPPPPPTPVAAPEPPKPAPPKEVALPPEPPESVAAFPDEVEVVEDASDERLLRLLLADPVKAEVALHQLNAPDAWQVAVIAQFALKRGEKSFELDAEPQLPLPAMDAGVVTAAGEAWIAEGGAPLVAPGKKAPLAYLPLNTKVEVKALDGEWAELSVPVAQQAIYAETGMAPVKVSATPMLGRVKVSQLSALTLDAQESMRQALLQGDDEAGRLSSVAWWQHAWRIERSERTRAGLLRAAWAAKRASTVVHAALARNLASASGLRFAWACTGDDPSSASWLDLTKARPKSLPPSVCVSGLDARARCEDDTRSALTKAAATKAWLEGVSLTPKPWLRFTVDARDPRQVFVVTTPLEVADPCSEFEEVTFEAGSGLVRRLALPLGTRSMVIWVPVAKHAGAEFSIPSATSEGQAISWLRSRAAYRWTVGPKGDLEPSLGVNARTFQVSADVSATSFAVAPERDCSCQ